MCAVVIADGCLGALRRCRVGVVVGGRQHACRLRRRFWTDSRRRDYVTTTAAVRYASIAALKDAGISLPDPAMRQLVLRRADARQLEYAAVPQDQKPLD